MKYFYASIETNHKKNHGQNVITRTEIPQSANPFSLDFHKKRSTCFLYGILPIKLNTLTDANTVVTSERITKSITNHNYCTTPTFAARIGRFCKA